jgi:hypothetical protein
MMGNSAYATAPATFPKTLSFILQSLLVGKALISAQSSSENALLPRISSNRIKKRTFCLKRASFPCAAANFVNVKH